MKEEAYSILKVALSNHRELILGSKSACLGIMKDYGGREHPEVNLFADALDEDIPNKLLRSKPVTQEIIDRLADQLAGKRFYNPEMSRFAVGSWAQALDLFPFDCSATDQSNERMWFFYENNSSFGPLPESQIQSMINIGKIDATTLVWSEGMPCWESAAGYFHILNERCQIKKRQWHYHIGNKTSSTPLTESRMLSMVRSGKLHPDTLIWSEGMASWESVSNVFKPIPLLKKPSKKKAATKSTRPRTTSKKNAFMSKVSPKKKK